MEIKFTIKGNPDDPAGNPVPKLKMTGRQHWMPGAKRYVSWKSQVVLAFLDAVAEQHPAFLPIMHKSLAFRGKPIELLLDKSAEMELTIFWKNDAHADPENVFGSIADALFKNDKNLYGRFDEGLPRDGRGRVEVTIKIS